MPPRIGPLSLSRHIRRPFCQPISSGRVIKEHDVIVLRQHGAREAKFHLSPPLKEDTSIQLAYGATVNGSDVIGKTFMDRLSGSDGRIVRLLEATLAQYVMNSPRPTTPIYPQDANLIVSFLDINLPNPGEDPDFDAGPPVEIFEAGTGMGALTLHLARAIHGANPPLPPQLRKALSEAAYEKVTMPRKVVTDDDELVYDVPPHALSLADPELTALHEKHVAGRRAIIHTLDNNPASSRKAHRLVRHFRRGQYILDVDFHVGTIRSYLASRLSRNGSDPFLAHAILDLPASQEHADLVVKALQPGGKVVVFFPSVTQILDFVVWAKEHPLVLERVVELQTSTSDGDVAFRDGLGGRHWDVKTVSIRKASLEGEAAQGVVCRPKVGGLVVGGGFVAVFTRMPQPDRTVPKPADEMEPTELNSVAESDGLTPGSDTSADAVTESRSYNGQILGSDASDSKTTAI